MPYTLRRLKSRQTKLMVLMLRLMFGAWRRWWAMTMNLSWFHTRGERTTGHVIHHMVRDLQYYPSLSYHVFQRTDSQHGNPVAQDWIRKDNLDGLWVFVGINQPIFHAPLQISNLVLLSSMLMKLCHCSNQIVCLLHTCATIIAQSHFQIGVACT
jgi:hypothetical protein